MKDYRDPAALRRLDFAQMWRAEGDAVAALDAVRAALELEPGWPEALFLEGELLAETGASADAIAAWCRYLAAEPADVMGAAIRLAQLRALPAPEILPEAYVRTLFDQYADRFEESLLGRLQYRAPQALRSLWDRLGGGAAPRVLDLGCGTGLSGETFRAVAGWLVGVDLSPGMLAVARTKGIYDELAEGEALAWLGARGATWDLIVAADMVVYVGDLAPLLAMCAKRLAPGGRLLFSAQRTEAADWLLGADARYAHAPAYLQRTAAACGLEVEVVEATAYRTEGGEPVPGQLVALRRTGLPARDRLPEGLFAARRDEPPEMPTL